MKVTINGNDVSPNGIHAVLVDLEKEYGIKISDLTMYIRFTDANGRVVDPKLPANGNELVITLSKEREPQRMDKPLSIEQLKDLLELHIGRPLIKSEMNMVVEWADEYQITYQDFNYVMGRQSGTQNNFRSLDRRFYLLFKAKKEKEITNR